MIRRVAGRALASFALGVATWCAAAPAHANGRFPAAQYVVVGPGAASELIVLRATFGLIVSRDGGATFRWVCEEALQYSGVWDAPVAIAADGSVLVGLTDGLVATPDRCAFGRNASLEGTLVQDLASDPRGETVLGIESSAGAMNHVLRSHDRGATFVRAGVVTAGLLPTTVEAAPTDPLRVYVTATDLSTMTPHLFRSTDEGDTLVDGPSDFAGSTELYVAGVDPTDARRVWLRGVTAAGTVLLRTDDGGSTVTPVATTVGPMLGFAVSEDGAHVWYGGPDDGLFRSDDGGRVFVRVGGTHVTCLRHHGGALYVCADWVREPFALARIADASGALLEPLVRFADVPGVVACDPGTVEHDTCGTRWPAMRTMFVTRDAGTSGDSGGLADAAMDARRDGAMDAGTGDAESRTSPSCQCVTRAGRSRGDAMRAAWWVIGLALAARRSTPRASSPRNPAHVPRARGRRARVCRRCEWLARLRRAPRSLLRAWESCRPSRCHPQWRVARRPR